MKKVWGKSIVVETLVGQQTEIQGDVHFAGGLHLDGLSDTADGFLSARPRDRRCRDAASSTLERVTATESNPYVAIKAYE